jgi:hypothetical protein
MGDDGGGGGGEEDILSWYGKHLSFNYFCYLDVYRSYILITCVISLLVYQSRVNFCDYLWFTDKLKMINWKKIIRMQEKFIA